jgi:hypothetical protein
VDVVSTCVACSTSCHFMPAGTDTGTDVVCFTPPSTTTSVPIATIDVCGETSP